MALLNYSLTLTDKDLNRLWSKVIKGPGENDCWSWTDVLSEDGYAYLGIGGRKGRKFLVHRLLYELVIGPIPDGKDLDHCCRNRYCVRPDHQEPVTRRENLLRGKTITAAHAAATHCSQGHPFDIFNTGFYRNQRYCRTCQNTRRRERRREAKENAV
jgi:hypothetical protein